MNDDYEESDSDAREAASVACAVIFWAAVASALALGALLYLTL